MVKIASNEKIAFLTNYPPARGKLIILRVLG